jgi:hypothetical protein
MISVHREVTAVLAAAEFTVLSAAERPDSPFVDAPAIQAASSIRTFSTVLPGAPFGYVA